MYLYGGRDWATSTGNGVPILILEPDGGKREGRTEKLRLELVGDPGEIRTLKSWDHIIRQIGLFQSPISSPVEEVVGVAVVVGDGLFGGESDVWEG
jgi:hypothetical protein